MTRSARFHRVFLRLITQRDQLGMAHQRVGIDADLGIERDQIAFLGDDQRIDLDQAGVVVDVQLVQRLEDGGELRDLVAGQLQAERQIAGLIGLEAHSRMNRFTEDLLGVMSRDFFDVHAAGSRGHHSDTAFFAVQRQAEINLAFDTRTAFDIHLMNRQAGRAGLRRDQALAQQLCCGSADIRNAFDFLDAAGLTAATGMDLRLDDPHRAAETAGNSHGLFGRGGGFTGGHRNAVGSENFLGLVFVQIHR